MEKELNHYFRKNFARIKNQVDHNIANGQMSDYSTDVLGICIEAFLKRSNESKLQMLNDNKIENFILKCCSLQLKSGDSTFFYQFRKYYRENGHFSDKIGVNLSDSSYIPVEEQFLCFEKEMQNLNWYERKLVDSKFFGKLTDKEMKADFFQEMTLADIASEIKRVLRKIRKKCQNCD